MTYDNEIAGKVLQILYDSWFKDFYAGLSVNDIINIIRSEIDTVEENQINQAVAYLASNGWINENDPTRYIITGYGIDVYEQTLPLEIQAVKKQERTKILEILAETYRVNLNELMHSEILREKIQIKDPLYLRILVTYFEDKNLVILNKYSGTLFFIRLSPEGFESLKDPINDNSAIMASAYQLLFSLENYLREFIKDKLISKYKNDWWEKGTTLKIKDNANKNRLSESSEGWQISEVKSNMDYLYFEDLGSIIRNNWDLFNTTFNDQEWVTSRLKILEKIHHAIAHTRTLTFGGMTRLNQNGGDLMGRMVK